VNAVHSGVWWPGDRAAQRYRYVPVDVPPGARSLRVELAFDRSAGVLDLGLFDPAGRFRGYSGGARDAFVVGETTATPGYLPGPLPAGTWQVLLGLHRLPAAGLGWSLTAETSRDLGNSGLANEPQISKIERRVRGRARELPSADGMRWLAGDLHAHTVHSDGAHTVADVAALAADAGLDFLAVTDHNTVSHHPELAATPGVVLVPGQEVTTDRGHANAFGPLDWVDFRRPPDDWLSTVEAAGGLLSVNHPLAGDCAWLMPMARRPPLAEVWHSGWWDRTWGAPLAWLLAWAPDAVAVGGSDFHRLSDSERLGRPTTWVAAAEPSVAGILDGLRAGRTAISADPRAPVLLRLADRLVAVDADGALLVDPTGRRRPVHGDRAEFAGGAGPSWLEDGRAQILAIT